MRIYFIVNFTLAVSSRIIIVNVTILLRFRDKEKKNTRRLDGIITIMPFIKYSKTSIKSNFEFDYSNRHIFEIRTILSSALNFTN